MTIRPLTVKDIRAARTGHGHPDWCAQGHACGLGPAQHGGVGPGPGVDRLEGRTGVEGGEHQPRAFDDEGVLVPPCVWLAQEAAEFGHDLG